MQDEKQQLSSRTGILQDCLTNRDRLLGEGLGQLPIAQVIRREILLRCMTIRAG